MRQSHLITIGLLTISATVACGIWWLCERSNSIAFLAASPGAEWIVDPRPPQSGQHPAFPLVAIFNRAFQLNSQPANARLSIRAFKNASVKVNDHEVDGLNCTGKNWKSPATADIARLLQTGTNTSRFVSPTPPAPPRCGCGCRQGKFPWARTRHGWSRSPVASGKKRGSPRSGQSFQTWNPIYDSRRAPDSVRRVWPWLALFWTVSLALIWGWTAGGADRWRHPMA